MANALDEFMSQHNRARSPVVRLAATQGVKPANDARVNVTPDVIATAPDEDHKTYTKMEYKPTGHQPAPGVAAPGSFRPRVVPVRAPSHPVAVEAAGPPPVDLPRANPLDEFMAAYQAKAPAQPRPIEKLVMGRTKGMQL